MQGRKNALIFLTSNIAFWTFLQGFKEEINKMNHVKPMKYVRNIHKMSLSFSKLLYLLHMLILHHISISRLINLPRYHGFTTLAIGALYMGASAKKGENVDHLWKWI